MTLASSHAFRVAHCCFILLSFFHVAGQESFPVKREVRAVWIATVENIDWPKADNIKKKSQKSEALSMLDEMRAIGINTVFFQVRPSSDAFYRKGVEPWSEWLSGEQGKGLWYDPLKFMIQECHKRGMELHAWFNPFRAVHLGDLERNTHKRHITRTHPEWLVPYGRGVLVNPGIPEARDYVVSVISSVVAKYDVDGVHLDDYFYPYPYQGQEFPDQDTYAIYGQNSFDSRAAWRRNNINEFIRVLGEAIGKEKSHVKFGVSPFGVWRNQSNDPKGSKTWAGVPSYDSLYADTRHWLQEGWIDYLVPQLYWSIGFKAAGFDELLAWWASQNHNRHIYAGHALYKIRNNHDKRWDNISEMPNQVRLVRHNRPNVQGSAFFRAGFLRKNPASVTDSLQRLYKHIAIPPVMSWKEATAVKEPEKLRVRRINEEKIRLTWKQPKGKKPSYYAIYKFGEKEGVDLRDSRKMIAVVEGSRKTIIVEHQAHKPCRYIVSSFDRLWREYPSKVISER